MKKLDDWIEKLKQLSNGYSVPFNEYIIYKRDLDSLIEEFESEPAVLRQEPEPEGKTVDSTLSELKLYNPYPEYVFIPIPDKELKKIVKLLKANGYSPDCLFGNWGRTVWNNCVEKANELFERSE